MTRTVTIAIVMLGLSSLALAGAKAPAKPAKPGKPKPPAAMPVPKPAPEVEGFKNVAGVWKCTGSVKAADGKDYKYTVNFTITPLFDGMWYEATYDRSKVGAFPALLVKLTLGYDSADKTYVMNGVDSWGGWLALTSADALAWGGYSQVAGAKLTAKWTFAMTGTDLTSVMEMAGASGGFKATDTCKR